MGKYTNSPVTFTTGENIDEFMRVKAQARTIYLADSSDYGIGVTGEYAASGKDVAVRLNEHGGTLKMTASGAITSGQTVYAAADGKIAQSGTLLMCTA